MANFKGVVKMKTLIELFDEGQINNVVAGLRFNPEKIIYVGFKEVMTNRRQKALNEFFYLRNSKIKFEYEIVGRYDFEAIVERLNFILDTNEDCYFDLTGGKELVLTAMGFVSQKRNIPMFQINIRKGEVINVFLAVLELLKRQVIRVKQEDNYEEIEIVLREEEPTDVE